jgi:hypothetical protein
VTAERFVTEAAALLPTWWEIVVVEFRGESIELNVVREGSANPSPLPRTQAEFIWRDDALRMLAARGGAHSLRRQPRRVLWDRLCAVFTAEEIAAEVRTLLKARTRAREAGERSS